MVSEVYEDWVDFTYDRAFAELVLMLRPPGPLWDRPYILQILSMVECLLCTAPYLPCKECDNKSSWPGAT